MPDSETGDVVRRRSVRLPAAMAWFLASFGLGLVASLVVSALTARQLGVTDFGRFAGIVALAGAAGQIALTGFPRVAMREMVRPGLSSSELLQIRRASRAVGAYSLAVTCAVAVLVGMVVMKGSGSPERWLVPVEIGLLIVGSGVVVMQGILLRGHGRVRVCGLLEGRSGGPLVACIQALIMVALVFGLSGSTLDLSSCLAVVAGSFLLTAACGAAMSRGAWNGPRPGPPSWVDWRWGVARSWRFGVFEISAFLVIYSELWVANLVLSPTSASEFAGAQRIALLVGVLVGTVQVVFSPVISRLIHDPVALSAVVRAGATLVTGAGFLILLPLIVMPARVLHVFLGPSFEGASAVLMILALATFVSVATVLASGVLAMGGFERQLVVINFVALAARVVGCVAFGVTVGLLGLVAASAVVTVVHCTVLLVAARRSTGVWALPTWKPDLGAIRLARA